jgi:hypothetical protein
MFWMRRFRPIDFSLARLQRGEAEGSVAGTVAVGHLDEQVAQISVVLDAVHFTCADQAGELCPIPAALVLSRKQGVAAVNGRASDCVFNKVGVDVDAAVVKEQMESLGASLQAIFQRAQAGGDASEPGGMAGRPSDSGRETTVVVSRKWWKFEGGVISG